MSGFAGTVCGRNRIDSQFVMQLPHNQRNFCFRIGKKVKSTHKTLNFPS